MAKATCKREGAVAAVKGTTIRPIPVSEPVQHKWRGFAFDIPPLSPAGGIAAAAPSMPATGPSQEVSTYAEAASRGVEAAYTASNYTSKQTVQTPSSTLPPNFTAPFRLLALPKEIQLLILHHTLYQPKPIPIHPDFKTFDPCFSPVADYRVLHSCRQFYADGLPIYYAVNTFSIDLHKFAAFEETFSPRIWPKLSGQLIASELVKRVHLRARERRHEWFWAVRCLRGFENLDEVVFDLRAGQGIDDVREGVKTGGTSSRVVGQGKNEMRSEGTYDLVKLRVKVEDLLGMLLKKAEIKVGGGGVWVGNVTEEVAKETMEIELIPAVLRAFDALEELKNLRAGVPSEKEYRALMEEGQKWAQYQQDENDGPTAET